MKGHHLEWALLHTGGTTVAGAWHQEDGSRGFICVQGLSGAGGYAGWASAETTDVRLIQSQRFILRHADAGSGRAESPVVPRYTGYLTGPAATAQVRANLDPFHATDRISRAAVRFALTASSHPARESGLHCCSPYRCMPPRVIAMCLWHHRWLTGFPGPVMALFRRTASSSHPLWRCSALRRRTQVAANLRRSGCSL